MHEVLDSPNAVHVSFLWPWRKLFWESTDVGPVSLARELGDFSAGRTQLFYSLLIDELGDDDIADFVELIQKWVRGGGDRHGGDNCELRW